MIFNVSFMNRVFHRRMKFLFRRNKERRNFTFIANDSVRPRLRKQKKKIRNDDARAIGRTTS